MLYLSVFLVLTKKIILKLLQKIKFNKIPETVHKSNEIVTHNTHHAA